MRAMEEVNNRRWQREKRRKEKVIEGTQREYAWSSASLARGSTVRLSGSIAEVSCGKRSSALRETVVFSLSIQRVVLRELWLIVMPFLCY